MVSIDKASSERLHLLRFPLIVGVVYIHGYEASVKLADGSFGMTNQGGMLQFIREFISNGLARTAVPLFFLISGYLLFWSFSYSLEAYGEKLKSRVKSLLIPYLFWNAINLAVYALIELHPATRSFLSGRFKPVSAYGAFDYLNAFSGIQGAPIAMQFWFIRDLIIVVALSPLFYLMCKYIPKIALCILFALWYTGTWWFHMPSIASVAFFYAGAFFAFHKTSLFSCDRFGKSILGLYAVILVADALTKEAAFSDYVHKLGILTGIISVLFISQMLARNEAAKKFLMWAGSGAAFFVFAVHEPLQVVTRKIVFRLLSPHSELLVLFLYLSIPIFVIGLAMLIYVLAQKSAPRILSAITGGR